MPQPPSHYISNLAYPTVPGRRAAALLERGGRLGIISFHSGEDRAVKRAFRALEAAGFIELVPSPVTASDPEVSGNPRARSAKLRVLKRLEAA